MSARREMCLHSDEWISKASSSLSLRIEMRKKKKKKYPKKAHSVSVRETPSSIMDKKFDLREQEK